MSRLLGIHARPCKWLRRALAILPFVLLIAVYSIIMIATGGSAPAAWLLLIGGIATLIATGARARRQRNR